MSTNGRTPAAEPVEPFDVRALLDRRGAEALNPLHTSDH